MIAINNLEFHRDGRQCDECIPLGGCVHGGCQEPFECDCSIAPNIERRGKYSGVHCDQRKFIQKLEKYWRFFSNISVLILKPTFCQKFTQPFLISVLKSI